MKKESKKFPQGTKIGKEERFKKTKTVGPGPGTYGGDRDISSKRSFNIKFIKNPN